MEQVSGAFRLCFDPVQPADQRLGGEAGEQPGQHGGDDQVGQVGHHGPGAQHGGGGQQLPEAVADDGMFDVSLIRPVHFWHLLFRFHYLFNGGIYRIRHVLRERGSRIRIESSPEVSVEVDGESLGESPLEFTVLHRAIRIVVAREFLEK